MSTIAAMRTFIHWDILMAILGNSLQKDPLKLIRCNNFLLTRISAMEEFITASLLYFDVFFSSP